MGRNMRTKKSKKGLRAVILLVVSLFFAVIAIAVAIVGCNYVTNRNFKETFYSVSSLKVNNKIRVVQISDLHNCVYGQNNGKLIDRVQRLKPDIILYTGDCIDSVFTDTKAVSNLCAKLAKVAPSYYIYGNNEVEKIYNDPLTQESLDKKFGFSDANRDSSKLLEMEDAFAKTLEAGGVKVLKNQSDSIVVGTTKVDIFGVLTSNPSSFWAYAGHGFEEYVSSNENHLKIMAMHEPVVFEQYTPGFWGDLMFAGHSHGGIVQVPMFGPLYTQEGGILPERSGAYVSGRYEVEGKPLIVSAGLENKTFFRINNPPEIVIVDINRF